MYPFRCPTTHLRRYPLLGVSALNGIVKSVNDARRSPAVVLIDPGAIQQSELSSLREAFGETGYLMRTATGTNATAGQARELTEILPSDFIFYSTHCGEVRGRRITGRFFDRHGNAHEIAYDLVRNLSLSSTPRMIHVENFMRFLSLDGINWKDDAGKRRINAGDIMKDFIAFDGRRGGDPKQYEIIDSVESPPINRRIRSKCMTSPIAQCRRLLVVICIRSCSITRVPHGANSPAGTVVVEHPSTSELLWTFWTP